MPRKQQTNINCNNNPASVCRIPVRTKRGSQKSYESQLFSIFMAVATMPVENGQR